jgi:pimeloyl-ACP methyl ester carboxylesterase
MKRLRTILIFIGIAILLLVLGIFIFLFVESPGSTKEFKDKQGNVIESSIAKMEYVKLGGVEQFILIRGKSINNPLLLILHGGPGNPELPMYRMHNSELENYFTVVYWDQRGAGKSASKDIPEDSFTLNRFVEDAHELTAYLKKQFKKDKIFILGHSWGSLLGIQTINKYPNDYYAYIGTGQFGNQPKSEKLAYQYSVRKAKEANDTVALKDLKEIGEYNDNNLKRTGFMNWLFVQRVYISKFGGSTADPAAAADVFLLPILYCKEYTIGNKYNLMKSNSQSAFVSSPFRKMIPVVLKTDLSNVKELQIPVYILQGKNDCLTNYAVAKEYFDSIKAPKKEFITFDKSAHFVPFEEPEKFNSFMINRVLKECRE